MSDHQEKARPHRPVPIVGPSREQSSPSPALPHAMEALTKPENPGYPKAEQLVEARPAEAGGQSPGHTREPDRYLATHYVMNVYQKTARPQDPATIAGRSTGEHPDTKKLFSQVKSPTKKITVPALSNKPRVAQVCMEAPTAPRKPLTRLGIALVIPLAIWCAAYTAPINTNPIPAPCAGPRLVGYVLPPTTPAPVPGDWIGAFYDTMQVRCSRSLHEQNEVGAATNG